ncbi:MAG: ABC transporter permease subunit [Dehalococcoidia bacterium]|nr:ABC transporter permease subunit [Dehalococcoidia bacterium]
MRRVNERVLSPRATLRRAFAPPGQAHTLRPRPGRWALLALVLLVPGLLWPLLALLWQVLTPEGSLSLAAFGDVLTTEGYRDRLVFSAAQAFVATALAAGLGLPVAWALARARFPGHRAFRGLMVLPFLLPPVAVGAAFRELLGVDLAATAWGAVLAHGWMGLGAVAALVSVAWARLDGRAAETARLLGAPRWRAFIEVTLPALGPSLAAAAALAFTLALTSFGTALLLGGGQAEVDTLEVAAFRLVGAEGVSADVGALALLQLPLTLLALGVYAVSRWPSTPAALPARAPEGGRGADPLLWAVVCAAAALVVVPLGALLVAALTEGRDGLSAANFRALSDEGAGGIAAGDALLRSLAYALGGSAAALVAGAAAVFAVARWQGRARRWSAGLLLLPAAAPAVLLALTYRAGFDQSGAWLVLLAHAVIAYPFVVRPLLAARLAASRGLAEAPRTLGASPGQAWQHAELRALGRAMMVGAVFAAVVSLGETGATALLADPDASTAPIVVLQALGPAGAGEAGPAIALAALLAGLVTAAVVAVESVAGMDAGRDAGEF